jgi:hypothetical protein
MMEMLALFVGYFFFESDASNWWWTAFWIIVGLKMLERLSKARKEMIAEMEKEVEEQRIYWEGKNNEQK